MAKGSHSAAEPDQTEGAHKDPAANPNEPPAQEAAHPGGVPAAPAAAEPQAAEPAKSLPAQREAPEAHRAKVKTAARAPAVSPSLFARAGRWLWTDLDGNP